MLADPAVAKLADLVEIREDDDHNAAFPGKRWARVWIELTDGRRLESPDTEASGDPHLALTDQQVRAKFHDYADQVLGVERAAAIEPAARLCGRDLISAYSEAASSSLLRHSRHMDTAQPGADATLIRNCLRAS